MGPQPILEPVELVQDFIDVMRRRRMDLDPDGGFRRGPGCHAYTIVPARIVGQYRGQGTVQVYTACNHMRITA